MLFFRQLHKEKCQNYAFQLQPHLILATDRLDSFKLGKKEPQNSKVEAKKVVVALLCLVFCAFHRRVSTRKEGSGNVRANNQVSFKNALTNIVAPGHFHHGGQGRLQRVSGRKTVAVLPLASVNVVFAILSTEYDTLHCYFFYHYSCFKFLPCALGVVVAAAAVLAAVAVASAAVVCSCSCCCSCCCCSCSCCCFCFCYCSFCCCYDFLLLLQLP